MASEEVVQKLCSDPDLQKSCNQFSNMFKDRPEALKQTLQTIAKQIADDPHPENRPRYLLVLVDMMSKNSTKLPSSELADLFKNCLPQEGHRVQKRARRMALVYCYFGIVKAGFTRKNTNLLGQLVQEIFDISQNNLWFQLTCYKILAEIFESEIPSEDSFLDTYYPILEPTKVIEAPNADSLYFWLKLSNLYPKIELSDFFKDPLTNESFTKYAPLLKKTVSTLPTIHPIWPLFAEIDALKLIHIVAELWLEKGLNRALISIACAAAIPYLESSEIIELIENVKLFEFALTTKNNKNFTISLGQKIEKMIVNADEISFKAIHALLMIPNEHSFVINAVNQGCSSYNDEQTRTLLNTIKDLGFDPICSLLWVQKHRAKITDQTIIADIYNLASEKALNFSEKVKLCEFISKNMQRIVANGKSWFEIISGHDFPTSEPATSIEALIQATNKAIEGLNAISAGIKITPIFDPCQVSLESFLDFISQLNKSKFEHWHQSSRILLGKAIPLLQPEHVPLLAKRSTLLTIAAKDPRLCQAALPFYVESADVLGQVNTEDRLSFPISPEGALRILPEIMGKCTGKSKNGYQEKVGMWLLGMVSDENATEIVKTHIRKILDDEKGTVGGEKLISELIKSSSSMGFQVITLIAEIGKQFDRNSSIKKLQTWIDDCCGSSDIPVEDIAKAIYAVLDHDYPATASGKKKAESYLSWAEKLIKKVQRQIPRYIFAPLCQKFIDTGSRNAAAMIRQISSVE